MSTYLVVIEKADGNYSAYSPDLPGCISTGATIEETKRNMHEAIAGHLEILRESGEPLPESSSVADYVSVD